NCYCRQRGREELGEPWVDGTTYCLEQVTPPGPVSPPPTPSPVPQVNLDALTSSTDELAYTALTTDDDGTLYATRPLTGQVFAFDDSNGDFLPDRPRLVAEGLTLPNGIAYHDGALYVSGGTHLYRIALDSGQTETLVDDLPSGPTGFWTGDLTIGNIVGDVRIYVGTGAPCDFCDPDTADEGRGAIWSYALDGSDPQLIATGLRQPNDVAFVGDTLWTVDTARDGLENMDDLDELNLVQPAANFGWPYCVGADNQPDSAASPLGSFDCASANAPALTFPPHSSPMGLAAYRGDALPSLQGRLLVVLYGPYNDARLQGFAVAAVRFDDAGSPIDYDIIIPSHEGQQRFTLEEINYRRSGLWPNRPLDVTVDIHGWVYVSILNGRIIALRQHTDLDFDRYVNSCDSP
ncbi:MAG: PQQ-dependent sugar dehydrogenase, partial [Burkholderiales bacterium]|nr:PQQ-dependent sugar dehydrogenase [Anaerolineae bacterium]